MLVSNYEVRRHKGKKESGFLLSLEENNRENLLSPLRSIAMEPLPHRAFALLPSVSGEGGERSRNR
jgi:hypothetical protein